MDLAQLLKLQGISKSTLYLMFNLFIIFSQLHKLNKTKRRGERRRPEPVGDASATVNQIQLSSTTRPASTACLLLLLISIQLLLTNIPDRTDSERCVTRFYPVGRG